MKLEDIFLYSDGSARAYISIEPSEVDTILSVGLASLLEAAVALEKEKRKIPALLRAQENQALDECYGGSD